MKEITMSTNLTIHATFLPHTDPEASVAFYRDILDFEVRLDVGQGTMRWITVGPVNQPATSIVLEPPAMADNVTDEERNTITGLMAKGAYGVIQLSTPDLDGTFEQIQAKGGNIVQEVTEQPWGARDFALRDPAGNHIRIQEQR
jgi:predicted enzyme related to lactoylglutathione lyase